VRKGAVIVLRGGAWVVFKGVVIGVFKEWSMVVFKGVVIGVFKEWSMVVFKGVVIMVKGVVNGCVQGCGDYGQRSCGRLC
jgi:hypothetical protein